MISSINEISNWARNDFLAAKDKIGNYDRCRCRGSMGPNYWYSYQLLDFLPEGRDICTFRSLFRRGWVCLLVHYVFNSLPANQNSCPIPGSQYEISHFELSKIFSGIWVHHKWSFKFLKGRVDFTGWSCCAYSGMVVQEIDQLCEEWNPEALHPPITDDMEMSTPVLERCIDRPTDFVYEKMFHLSLIMMF